VTASGPAARDLPPYDELPLLPKVGIPHAWEVFGRDDEFGTLNLLDDATVLAAFGEVRTGERIGITLPLTAIDPPLYGREPLRHTLTETDRNSWDDSIDALYPQASSQWDGLRHVRVREFGFFGGVTDSPPEMGERLGIHHWAQRGIFGRGVLLDVERYLRERQPGYDPLTELSIGTALLAEIAEAQGVQIRRGDLLCLRFGWTAGYRRLDPEARKAYAAIPFSPPCAGLAADESTPRALWNWQIAGLVSDNPAVEVSPGSAEVGNLHRRLLPTLGLAIGELFDFDALADRCAEDGRWTFLLAAVPLNVPGGVGSPANAVAIR
jgi:kynurenine formamidase